MSEVREYAKQEFADLLAGQYDEVTLEFAIPMVNGWLARGDGAAVYRNSDLGHYELGHAKIVSFGSDEAQLEPFCGICQGAVYRHELPNGEHVHSHRANGLDHEPQYPPQRLPDGLPAGAVNWRYQLEGIYRGEAL